MTLLTHSAAWLVLATISLSGWGTPVPGMVLAAVVTPGLAVWRSKRWGSWAAAWILPLAGLALFYGAVLLVPQVLPLPPAEDPLAAETSLALDTLAAGIAVSGLLTPPLEGWVQSKLNADHPEGGVFVEWVRGSYLAIGAALAVVLLLWNLPLDRVQAWSLSFSPAKVGAVVVGGVFGGIRGAWHARMLRDLPQKG